MKMSRGLCSSRDPSTNTLQGGAVGVYTTEEFTRLTFNCTIINITLYIQLHGAWLSPPKNKMPRD